MKGGLKRCCPVGRHRRCLIIAGYADSLAVFRGDLLAAMATRGWQVHAAAPALHESRAACDLLERIGGVGHDIPAQRAGTNPLADLWLTWKLFVLMRRIKPQVVLGYTIKPVIYGTIAGWMARVPRRFALVTGLGYAFSGGRRGWLPGLIQRLYRFALKRSGGVFFQNPDDQALFQELGVVPSHVRSVVVNGSGVDLSRFSPVPVPQGPASFLLLCRLLGDKGVREYVVAAERIRANHPEVRFRIGGWIDENPDAITQAELDGWMARGLIDYLGRLEDVRPAVGACAVYVLPSYREGTPRTVLEAMAMGRAIITTDAPGCRETVVEGKNGFLVLPRSVNALVTTMEKFVADPTLAESMGQASREIAETKYDVHEVNAAMLREMGMMESNLGADYR